MTFKVQSIFDLNFDLYLIRIMRKNLPNAPKSTEINILLFTTKSQSFENPLGVTKLTNKTKPAGIDSKKLHSYKFDIFCPI